VSRQGPGVVPAGQAGTVSTVQQAADVAIQAGRRRYADAASSDRAVQGDVPACVK